MDCKMEYKKNRQRRYISYITILLLVMMIAICPQNVSAQTRISAQSAIKKPIVLLNNDKAKSVRVITNTNNSVSGYEIWYAKKKNFKGKKKKTVSGVRVNKQLKKLSPGKRYYFKVRAFTKTNGAKQFGPWSKVKSIKAEKGTAKYTSHVFTTLHTKKNNSSKTIQIWYNTKVRLIKNYKSSAGTWAKVKYRGKTYYSWIPKKESRFVSKSQVLSSYAPLCKTEYQRETVTKAKYVLDHWKTGYDFKKKYSNGRAVNGRYLFHCSGFATWVINDVMKKRIPPYKASENLDDLPKTQVMYNEGLKGEFKAQKVCGSKLNLSALQPGDILFFKMNSSKIDHCAIYLGKGQIIQSTKTCKNVWFNSGKNTTGGVCIAPIADVYKRSFAGAIRILPVTTTSADLKGVTTKNIKIYRTRECNSGTQKDQIAAGSEVTILYTYKIGANENAYARYESNKYGYIYRYKESIE